MHALGRYDSSLQMYVSEPREVSTAHLEFLRWLAERDRVTRGPSSGPFAVEHPRPTPAR